MNDRFRVLERGSTQLQPGQYCPLGVVGPNGIDSLAFSLPINKFIVFPSSGALGPISNAIYLEEVVPFEISIDPTS